jgi:hypothetical protein
VVREGGRQHVPRRHAPGAHDGIIPDPDAWQDDRAAADPDVSADPHGHAALVALLPQRRVARVVGRVDLNQRTDLAIVTEFDRGNVQEHATKVYERPAPEADVVAVVAMERRMHNRSLACAAEQLGQNGYAALHLVGARGVVGAEHPVRALVVGSQFRPDSSVQLAREHTLLHG